MEDQCWWETRRCSSDKGPDCDNPHWWGTKFRNDGKPKYFRCYKPKTVRNASYFDCDSKRRVWEDHDYAESWGSLIPGRKESAIGGRRSAGQSIPITRHRRRATIQSLQRIEEGDPAGRRRSVESGGPYLSGHGCDPGVDRPGYRRAGNGRADG